MPDISGGLCRYGPAGRGVLDEKRLRHALSVQHPSRQPPGPAGVSWLTWYAHPHRGGGVSGAGVSGPGGVSGSYKRIWIGCSSTSIRTLIHCAAVTPSTGR
jgi:hypothetical protein